MKKIVMTMVATALVAGIASAAEVTAGVDVASSYVFRGVTFNEGWVAQPAIKVAGFPIDEKFGAIAVGAWGNYDLDPISEGGSSSMSEVDYYVIYTLPVEVVDLNLMYTEYTYEGATSDKEVAASIGKALGESGFYPSFTANYGVGGAVDEDWYLNPKLDYSKALNDSLTLAASIGLGYVVDEDGADGFNDATAKVGLTYAISENWSIGPSITYIAQLDDEVLTDEEHVRDLVAMFSVGCTF